MPKTDTSPLALFKRFQLTHRKTELKLLGLGQSGANSLYFAPTNSDYSWIHNCYLDLKEAGVTFSLQYDPRKEVGPVAQMNEAAWAAILEGPFANRTFYADPAEHYVERAIEACCASHGDGTMPIRFSHDGDPIPGLHLSSTLVATSWRFFIPDGTPERIAMDYAFRLERARRQEKRRTDEALKAPNFAEMEGLLSAALCCVPIEVRAART